MAHSKIGRNKIKGQRYFTSKKRIKNKTRELLKSIKNLKSSTQEKVISCCPIKRKREKDGI